MLDTFAAPPTEEEKLWSAVTSNAGDFQSWTKLISETEQNVGLCNRFATPVNYRALPCNMLVRIVSCPAAISCIRPTLRKLWKAMLIAPLPPIVLAVT